MSVDWQVAYLLTTTIALILLCGAAAYGWRFRDRDTGFWYAAFCMAAAAWTALVALMALSPPDWAARWLALKYLFIQLAPVAVLMYALAFADLARGVRGRILAVLLVVPVLTQAVVWTNDLHHAMLRELVFERTGMLTYLSRVVFGPFYWVNVAHGYLLVLASLVVVIGSAWRAGALARAQAAAIAVGILAPAIANVLLITGIFPRVADPMPLGVALTALVLWWTTLRHRLLDLVPVARNMLVDALADGMLAVDARGRAVDLNPAMAAILGLQARTAIGRPASELLAAAPELAARFPGAVVVGGETGLARPGDAAAAPAHPAPVASFASVCIGEREFEARVAPLPGAAQLLVLHDRTERRRLERQRENLIAELRAALAKVRTLEGLLPMCARCKCVRGSNGAWLPVDEYLRDQAGATVSHGICPKCRDALYPRQYAP